MPSRIHQWPEHGVMLRQPGSKPLVDWSCVQSIQSSGRHRAVSSSIFLLLVSQHLPVAPRLVMPSVHIENLIACVYVQTSHRLPCIYCWTKQLLDVPVDF
uniref:Uncharacterized protein n=1 Tax=Setaria viridis TaxID=4556 RepID=A0A4U6VBN3_SETVI|nr:hypothetical protein SEVIR_3G205900v2 [Setaria viridis]